jgi:hypothetical protein
LKTQKLVSALIHNFTILLSNSTSSSPQPNIHNIHNNNNTDNSNSEIKMDTTKESNVSYSKEVVHILQSFKPKSKLIHYTDKQRRTCLHYAMFSGSAALVDTLLAHGASLEATDSVCFFSHSLHFALRSITESVVFSLPLPLSFSFSLRF